MPCMFDQLVLSLFLYFPEDKTEYIPAGITTFIFLIAALITTRLIVLKSRKEEKEANKLEEKIFPNDQKEM